MLSLLPQAISLFIVSLLWPSQQTSTTSLTFQLRHQHATTNSRTVFADVSTARVAQDGTDNVYVVNVHNTRTHKPGVLSAWNELDVPGPNVSDRETLRQLAMMTNNAYEVDPSSAGWYDLGPDWNNTYPFGWQPDADGFRGHVFVSTDNSTAVISIKGTSGGWLVGGSGPTAKKDKLNDNLLFSCCCAKVGLTWVPVCGCHAGGYKCNQNCLEKALEDDSLFYSIGINLYNNISYMYPEAKLWLVGHSLGSALASLIGVTFGAPVVAFEAPGEKLAASRLHLNLPPSTQHVTHVYHTGDPIATGTCNGLASACSIAGYAMESRCHLGKVIKYDTVTKLGWPVDIRTHGIKRVIEDLLSKDWDPEQGISVPEAQEEVDCVDCFNWDFGDYH